MSKDLEPRLIAERILLAERVLKKGMNFGNRGLTKRVDHLRIFETPTTKYMLVGYYQGEEQCSKIVNGDPKKLLDIYESNYKEQHTDG